MCIYLTQKTQVFLNTSMQKIFFLYFFRSELLQSKYHVFSFHWKLRETEDARILVVWKVSATGWVVATGAHCWLLNFPTRTSSSFSAGLLPCSQSLECSVSLDYDILGVKLSMFLCSLHEIPSEPPQLHTVEQNTASGDVERQDKCPLYMVVAISSQEQIRW